MHEWVGDVLLDLSAMLAHTQEWEQLKIWQYNDKYLLHGNLHVDKENSFWFKFLSMLAHTQEWEQVKMAQYKDKYLIDGNLHWDKEY